MLYNINIKVTGDIYYNQNYFDSRMNNMRGELERLITKNHLANGLRGDLNFEYNAEIDKFRLLSIKTNLKSQVERAIDIDYLFNKLYM